MTAMPQSPQGPLPNAPQGPAITQCPHAMHRPTLPYLNLSRYALRKGSNSLGPPTSVSKYHSIVWP